MLEEPFAQVMPLHIDTFRKLIEPEKQKKGILLTDHIYRQVRFVSDSLYLLHGGGARLVCRPEDLVRWGYVRNIE